MKTWTAKKLEMGNNETRSAGITQEREGATYTAMTYSQSKDGFKTFEGAQKWLEKRGFTVSLTPDSN